MPEPVVNRAQFAKIIGRSPPHVGHLMDLGLPHEGSGRGSPVQIPVIEALRWYLDYQESAQGSDGRQALVAEQIRALRLKNADAESRLMSADEARAVVLGHAQIYEIHLDQGARRLIAMYPDRAEQIREEIGRIKNETVGRLRAYAADLQEPR